jgi:hypothetical protein
VSWLGPVTLLGTLRSTGFVFKGHAMGSLTLSGIQGSVKLELQGPSQHGFAPLPTHFRFTVESGTGAFAHFHSHGTIDLQLDPAHHTFHLEIT